MRFWINADAWEGEGSRFGNGDVIAYEVRDMPNGQSARIAREMGDDGHEWRVMRIKGKMPADEWKGHFRRPEDALKWLQDTVDSETK